MHLMQLSKVKPFINKTQHSLSQPKIFEKYFIHLCCTNSYTDRQLVSQIIECIKRRGKKLQENYLHLQLYTVNTFPLFFLHAAPNSRLQECPKRCGILGCCHSTGSNPTRDIKIKGMINLAISAEVCVNNVEKIREQRESGYSVRFPPFFSFSFSLFSPPPSSFFLFSPNRAVPFAPFLAEWLRRWT